MPNMVGVEIPASGNVSGVAVGVAEAVADAVAVCAKTSEASTNIKKRNAKTRIIDTLLNNFFFITVLSNLLDQKVKSKL
jgi:hypothetical protein